MNAKTMTTARTLVLVAGTLAGAWAPARGAVLTWNNAAGGSAAVTTNWSPIALPGAGDTLVFNTSATFTVTFGATVTASTSHTYKRGNVTVSLASPHTTSSFVRVGDVSGDSATMVVGSGTLHAGGGIAIGNSSGATGTLTVSGEGTLADTTGGGTDIIVGNAGTGTLNITGGASAQPADDVIVAAATNSVGHLNVTGTGGLPLPAPASTLNLPNAGQDVTIGALGAGDLTVSSGAIVNADEMFVALNPGSTGIVNVSGTGGILNLPATINIATSLHLGNNPAVGASGGSATFTVNSGGQVIVAGTTRIGDPQGVGSGTLTVNTGGQFTTTSLVATDSGGFLNLLGGELRIDGGSLQVRNDVLTLSSSTSGSPVMILENGASCTLSNNVAPFETLIVGHLSDSALTAFSVFSGSNLTVSAGDVILGNLAGSRGQMIFSGPGTTGTTPTNRFVVLGDAGEGQLLIQLGAHLTSGTVNLGRTGTGIGSATINGGNAIWNIDGVLAIGGTAAAAFGTGAVTIGGNNSGTVNVTSGGPATTSVRVWGAGDLLTIGQGGTLNCDGDVVVTGGFTLAGGTCNANELLLTTSAPFNVAGMIGGSVRLSSGSASLVLTGDLTVNRFGNSAGGIINSGTIEIGDHALMFTDPTLGSPAGLNTCHLGPAGVLSSIDALHVNAGFTLSGDGTVDAPIINVGSVVSQGSGLTFTKVLSGVGQGISGSRITFANRGGFTGEGDFSNTTPITALPGSVITATGLLRMGSTTSVAGFSSSGRLVLNEGADIELFDSNVALVDDVEFPSGPNPASSVVCSTGLSVTGRVTGTGVLGAASPSTIILPGTLDPGVPAAAGTILFAANNTALSSVSRTEIDILDATTHDIVAAVNRARINVDPPGVTHFQSDLVLGGTLILRVSPGHTPTAGETHRIIETRPSGLFPNGSGGDLSGAFAAVVVPPKWIIRIVTPGSPEQADGVYAVFCPADFNDDGNLDPDDLSDYITCFFNVPACPDADHNGDGNVDPDDLSDYITAFFAGCT